MKTALVLDSAEAAAAGPAPVRPRTVEELQRENEALRREIEALRAYRTLAYRDPLTNLWNRRYFDERLGEELARTRRKPEQGFSVLLVDVNDLKRINDEHGHQAGDEAIIWAASFLRGTMRSHDVCCRTGGDEFAVILPGVTPDECRAIFERLHRSLASANEARERAIGLSFGVASCPDDGQTAATLLSHADENLYRDKRRQKARNTPVSETAAVAAIPLRPR